MYIIKMLVKCLNNYRNVIYFKVLSCSLVKRGVILKQISQKVRLNRIKCYHFKVNESTVLKKLFGSTISKIINRIVSTDLFHISLFINKDLNVYIVHMLEIYLMDTIGQFQKTAGVSANHLLALK